MRAYKQVLRVETHMHETHIVMCCTEKIYIIGLNHSLIFIVS